MNLPSQYPVWTTLEKAVLRERYAVDGPKAVAAALGRPWKGVVMQAQKLGLLRQPPRWSQIEDRRLRNALDELPSIGWAARRLGRSPRAIYDRAARIGLPIGCPDGFERLSAAARRTGFDFKTLRRILRWAGVKTRLVLAQPNNSRARAKWHQHMADVMDVDDAVAAWMDTETPAQAARRLKHGDKLIVKRLLASGLKLPERHRQRPWRIPSALIDRAMERAA